MNKKFTLKKPKYSLLLSSALGLILLLLFLFNCHFIYKYNRNSSIERINRKKKSIIYYNRLDYDKNAQIIFIGGYARSGTTLMRAILDVHQEVNCGPETKIIPLFLEFFHKTISNQDLIQQIHQANIDNKKLDKSVGLFIDSLLNDINHANNYTNARKCTKDPNILYYSSYLNHIYPNAKFIYMVRDGRSVVYSLMKKLDESIRLNSIRKYLLTWNSYNKYVYQQCVNLGVNKCILVKYENLVTNPKVEIENVVSFLNLSWTDEFLHHEKYVGNKIKISKSEWSTEQIKQKIHLDSIRNWIGKIEFENENVLAERYDMFKTFNYLSLN